MPVFTGEVFISNAVGSAMNIPVHPVISWDAGVMEELKSIVLWIQYQDDVIQDVDEMPWSPVFLLDAEKAKALIAELERQLEMLGR